MADDELVDAPSTAPRAETVPQRDEQVPWRVFGAIGAFVGRPPFSARVNARARHFSRRTSIAVSPVCMEEIV